MILAIVVVGGVTQGVFIRRERTDKSKVKVLR